MIIGLAAFYPVEEFAGIAEPVGYCNFHITNAFDRNGRLFDAFKTAYRREFNIFKDPACRYLIGRSQSAASITPPVAPKIVAAPVYSPIGSS